MADEPLLVRVVEGSPGDEGSLQELELVYQLSTLMSCAKSKTEGLQTVCAELARFLGVPQAGLAVLNADRSAAEIVADYCPADSSSALGAVIPIADNPCMAYILEHRVPLVVGDAQADPLPTPVHELMRRRSIESMLIVPTMSEGEVIGTLGFGTFERREFGEADVNLAQHVANLIGQVLARRRAEEALRLSEELGTSHIARDITERKRSEEEIRRLKEFNEGIVQSMSEGIVIQDAEGSYTFVNPAASAMLGYTAEEIVDQHWSFVIPPDQSSRARAAQERRRRGESDRYALELVRKDGTRFPVLVSGRPRFSPETGEFTGTLAVFTDIGEQVQAEEKLARRAQEMAALYETLLEINAQPDLPTLLNAIVQRAVDLLGVRTGGLYIVGPEDESLQRVVSYDLPGELAGTSVQMGEEFAGRVALTGQALELPDYQDSPGWAAGSADHAFRRALGVPLKTGDRVIGVLDLIDDQKTGPFDEEQLRLVSLFADQAAIAVENARLFEETERLKAFNESIVQGVAEGILLEDNEGRIVFANPAMEAMLGRSSHDLEGRHWSSIVPEDKRERVSAELRRRHDGFENRYETRLLHETGTQVPVMVSARPVFEGSRFVGVLSAFTDITERVRAERELEERRRYLEALLASAPDAIVTLDPQHRLVEWNPGAENLFGYTRAEVIGRNIDDLITTDETCQEAAAITRRAMAGKRVPSTEAIRHRKDGSPVSVRLAGSPILVGDELIGVVGIYTDISEHKAAEEALSDSQSRLGGILSSMPDLVFAVDEEGRFTFHHSPDSSDPYVSPKALLGKRYTEVLPRHLNERFSRALEKVRRGEAAKFEYSIDIGDKECWFSASLSPIFLEDTFRGAVAVTREITERKRAVEALRSANRGLQMLSECNRVLSRVQDEQELLREVCRIAVEIGGYRLAWVGYARPDQARSVQPMAQAGFEEGYLDTVRISWADTERGRGPTGTAIRTGQPAAAKNVLTDPPFAPWREEATRRGYASSIALPLQVRGSTIGALIVYAARPDAFDSEEVSLLAELADNLAYGITALRAWSERRKAEAALRGYAERLEMLHDVDRAILEAASPEAIAQATLRRIQQIIPCQEATISAFGFEAAKSEVLAVQVADEARGKRPERGEGPGKGRAEGPGKGRAEGPGKGRAEEPPGVVEDKQSLRAARSLRHRSSLIAPLELPAGGVGLPERVTTPSEPAPSSPKARAAGVPMERDPRTQTAPTDMTIPLMAQGELIGTLHLSTEEWPGFSPEHVEMAYELAAPLAVAIQQARLHEQLGRHAGSLEETVSQRTRELKAERDRTQAILESLGEAVVVTDVAGTILYTNPATLSQTGFRSEELIGQRQRIWEGDQASAEAYSRMPDILSAGRTWGGEMVLRRKDGSLFDAAVTMAPLFDPDDTGTLVGSVCVQRDITPLKEAERIKDDFVSNVSHELRTPLSIITLISGNLERLYGHLDDDKRRTMIGSIREYVGLLNDLIGDVLEISRIDSGRVSKEREGVDLARLAGEEVEKQRPLAGRRSQTVTLAGEESLLVDGNEGQLRQVIRNLINNAIKFTPDRGQIACECRLVSSIMEPRTGWPGADALAGGHWAALRVVDTGIGIGPEHLPNLFQRFYRAETEGNIPGTGLGLAITHELVELHGGHITVESIPEEGSVFVIYLPLATEES